MRLPWSEYVDLYRLTNTEAKMLAALIDGGVQSGPNLMLVATGRRHGTDYCARVHIQRLRAKMRDFGVTITTIRGSGYIIEMPSVAAQ